jgi:hypothetical protein
MTLKTPTHVSECNELEVEQSPQREASEARIHVPEATTSHRERDKCYPTVARLSETIRVIECKDAPMDSATSIRRSVEGVGLLSNPSGTHSGSLWTVRTCTRIPVSAS